MDPYLLNPPKSDDELWEEDSLEHAGVPTSAIKVDYKSKDAELFNSWNATKSKRDLSVLLGHLNPLIRKSVNAASGTLPTAALAGEAKIWAIKAIKTFDPSKGFALSTHVTNYIKRVNRVNYKYMNAARLPEDMHVDFRLWNTAKQQLSDELSADPSMEDLSKRLGWSLAKVKRFNDRVYSDLIESSNENPTQMSQYDDNDLLMKSLLGELNPEELFILKNKGKLSSAELSAKLNINTNSLNYKSKKLTAKILTLKQGLGL